MKNGNRVARQIGGLRIARVTYDHHPISVTDGPGQPSIGAMIDQHIADTIKTGALVSEVSMFFETVEQQHQLAELYLPAGQAVSID